MTGFLKKIVAKPSLHIVTPQEAYQHEFKAGDRVEMVEMLNDPHPIKPGAKGTVESVNRGIGKDVQVWVKWDSGRRLAVLLPEDKIQKIQ